MALIRHYLGEQMFTPIACFVGRVPGGRTTDVFSLFFCRYNSLREPNWFCIFLDLRTVTGT